MKRYLSISIVLCGLLFSHFAFGGEWVVEQGDTIWKILKEACQVTPSMEKARVFARAVGIQNPDLILRGSRINTARGCAVFPESTVALLEKAVARSKQLEETIRGMQARNASLEAEMAKLRSDSDASQRNVDRHQEVSAQQGTGAKEYRTFFSDPVVASTAWLILAVATVALCLFIWFSVFRRGSLGAFELPRRRNEHGTPFQGEASIDELSQHIEKSTAHSAGDTGHQSLGRTLEYGFMNLRMPFTSAMSLRLYQLKGIRTVCFWCAMPALIDGWGYKTFKFDANGNPVFVATIAEFEQSVKESIQLFLEGKSDRETNQKIMAAMNSGLLQLIA